MLRKPNKKKKNWYSKVGLRLHFDQRKTVDYASKLVKANNVSSHCFFPFLHFEISKFKFKKKLEQQSLPDTHKDPYKRRNIHYSCYADSYIFSYYNAILLKEYEKKLDENSIKDNVIAYRSILKKVQLNNKKNIFKGKCNIDFAAEAFLEIEKRKNCYAIGLDIEGFFDNLSHQILYENLAAILEVKKLPPHWYQIYKVITDFHYINSNEILEAPEINLKKEDFWNDEKKSFDKICNAEVLRKIVKREPSIIHKNPKIQEMKGIPQGTNISGTLANIYLYEFDKNLKSKIEIKNKGYYRRYSDDILIIVDTKEQLEKTLVLIQEELSKVNLNISSHKTLCCKFENNKCMSVPCSIRNNPSKENSLQYLGFTYNGKCIQVRNGTLGNFWRDAIKHIKHIVIDNYLKNKRIPIAKIYGLYTHLNNRREDSYGNFYDYIRNSHNIFQEEYNFHDKVRIKQQMSKSWEIVSKLLIKMKNKYNISDEQLYIKTKLT